MFEPEREALGEIKPDVDTFLTAQFLHLEERSSILQRQWQALSEITRQSIDASMSLLDRFLVIAPEARRIAGEAASLAANARAVRSDVYEDAIDIADRWCALAAYAGAYIPFGVDFQDVRNLGNDEPAMRNRKRIVGVATRDSLHKTVPIEVTTRKIHPLYKKAILRTSRFLIHDEYNQCKQGDIVIALTSRPLSKRKHHSFVAKVGERVKEIERRFHEHRFTDVSRGK